MKRKLALLFAVLLAVTCTTLAVFAQSSAQSTESAAPLSTIDAAISNFRARQEAAAQENQYSACPGCGLNTLRISGENYDSSESEYLHNCHHGGFPYINDTSVVRSGTRTYLCDSCGHTYQETVTDEHINYCPFMEASY